MSSHAAVGPPVVAAPKKSSLPVQAVAYLVAVLAAAVALGGHFVLDVHTGDLGMGQWATFALLATASALAQLFVVITPRNQSYHMTIVFLVPAALILAPELLPLIAVASISPSGSSSATPGTSRASTSRTTRSTCSPRGAPRTSSSTRTG